MLRRALLFVVIVMGGFLAVRPVVADMRTWTDKSGQYSVEAEFVEIRDGKVRLKLKDGKLVALPLAKISKTDQQYLRDLLKQQREAAANDEADATGEATPPGVARFGRDEPQWAVGDRVQYRKGFDTVPATVVGVDGNYVTIHYDGAPESETDSVPASWVQSLSESTQQAAAWSWNPPAMKPSTLADYSGLRRPAFNPSAANRLTPDSAPTAADGAPPASVGLGGKFAAYEKLLTFDVALGDAPLAVVAYSGGKEFRDISTRLSVVDLATSAQRGNFSGPAKLKMIHLSPSGKRLATRCEAEDHWSAEFIDIWDIGEDGLTHIASWLPYATSPETNRKISAVQWVDDSRLLTHGGSGQLVMWQVDGAKAIYELKAPEGYFALSPGAKQLVSSGAKGVDVYEVDSGGHTAHLPAKVGAGPVAFSPSGRKLVVSGPLGAEVIDVQGEQPARQFYMSNAGGLKWLDEQFLLASDGLVIDAAKHVAAWRYKRSGTGWLDHGRFWYLAGNDDAYTLVNIALPHDAAQQAASSVNPRDVFAVAPGMAITLDVELGDPTANAEGLVKLTNAVQAAGLRVEAGQSITLTARTRGGDSQEMHYRRLGVGGDDVTMSVPTRFYDVELLVGGVKVWSSTGYQGAPTMPRVEEGESIQSAVARHMGVTAAYLPGVVPMQIVKAEFQQPRGESQLTERGIE